MSQWVGFMVSVETEDTGTYQGIISSATGSQITLGKAFCNGIPCNSSEVIISAEDITNLQLIEKQESHSGESTVTVAKPIPKRAGRTFSGSEIISCGKSNGTYSYIKSKPIDIEYKSSHQDLSLKSATPKNKSKSKWSKGWRDELCFGSPLENIGKDFDFEKNLALFDKQAIWDEINSQKPDVVRQTDKKNGNKYRHDENVLATVPTVYRQITVPKQEFCEYVTDDGLIIPSISRSLRNKLWCAADVCGLSCERRIELMGRAAAEMTLQLIGGGHRLNPHNTHQCPTVVVLCGRNRQGAMGINAARHLASHGVNTIVYTVSVEAPEVQREIALYKLTKNKIISTASKLPQLVDLIILSLCEDTDNPLCHDDLAAWTNSNKAIVLALDPPSSGTPGIVTKFSLVPVLPLAHSTENGKIYLCNLGFPTQIFYEVGIKYKSPFGSKFVIPLHLNDDV
ncbi:hypothetical protein PPYR_01008 [Photinus pyralis]|uniref:Enhancer of mRNA-decapping protein 3 n=1 Tax=Photinus pyralis TaxID=7054 RepID=A0A1Y1L019_PHOPY|nr:enhancer of mRNA-decapping protein 3 [Photinus pyralis]KAB0804038.1 hypothetical protein PPYR_01008 [Photinus pyralis]